MINWKSVEHEGLPGATRYVIIKTHPSYIDAVDANDMDGLQVRNNFKIARIHRPYDFSAKFNPDYYEWKFIDYCDPIPVLPEHQWSYLIGE